MPGSAPTLELTLQASQTVTASGTGTATASKLLGRFHRVLLTLDVTAVAAAGGDTLDVYIQKNLRPRGTAVWTDFVHFTQVLGNGGVKQIVAEVVNDGTAPTSAMHVVQDAALAVGANQGPWADDWRVKWVVAGGTASFTFSVEALLNE